MAINLKRINTKFLIIPLSVIVLGGINNNIQAMDDDYGHENPVNTNNNNIINTNKLKEKIKFSDFKELLGSLADYNYCSKDYKRKIYERFANIINLLPQFIKNDANSTTSYEICKRNIDEQGDIENSMISYETCLHYLLDFKCFSTIFTNFTNCLFGHIGFIKILKDYSKNFDKDEYKQILRIILNNYLDNIMESNDYFKSTLDNNNFFYSYDIFKYTYKRHFYYDKKHDLMVTICMPTVIKELVKIEYNNYMNIPLKNTISDKIKAISSGIMKLSDTIMNDSIIPYIKKSILELLDSYCKYKISEEKKIIKKTIMLENNGIYEYEKDIQKLKENLDESVIERDILFYDRARCECKENIQKLTKELNKFPEGSELEKIIEQAILGKEEIKQLTENWPESIKILRKEIGQVTKALDDKELINKIKKKLDIDYIVYNVAYDNLLEILNNYKHNLKKDEYKQILKIMLDNCLDFIFDLLEPAFWNYNVNNIFFNYQDYYNIHYINMRHFYLFYKVIDELAKFEYSNYSHMPVPIKAISDKIMNDLIMPHIKERIFKMLDSYCKNYISEKKEIIKKNIIDNNNSQNKYKQNLEQLEKKMKNGKRNENLKEIGLSYNCNKICLDECEKSIKELKKELEKLPKDSEVKKIIEQVKLNEEGVQQLTKDWPESIKELRELTSQVTKALDDKVVISKIRKQLEIDNEVYKATKNLRKEELMNTFSKKVKVGNAKIKSKDVVKEINDFTKDNRVVKIMQYTLPVVKQKVNENNESEEVTINNESEKK